MSERNLRRRLVREDGIALVVVCGGLLLVTILATAFATARRAACRR